MPSELHIGPEKEQTSLCGLTAKLTCDTRIAQPSDNATATARVASGAAQC